MTTTICLIFGVLWVGTCLLACAALVGAVILNELRIRRAARQLVREIERVTS